MESRKNESKKSEKIFIKSDEGNIIGEHWVMENGERGIRIKNKGFVPYKRLLPFMSL